MSIFRDERFSVLWLIVRLWLGWEWLQAGLGKVGSPAWTGDKAGAAISGFLKGAIAKSQGDHPAVKPTYAAFVENFALPNARIFSYLVAYGELLVGIALLLGFLTTFAALAGAFMNLNFMFAGSASSNPYMYTAAILLIAAGAIAGRIGLDYFILPRVRGALGWNEARDRY